MIVTLTPNPGIDRTVSVDVLHHGEVNRATASRIDPGGKGVNVSRALTAQGGDTLAVLPLGGPEGILMGQLLTDAGVAYEGVKVSGTLRMNVAVVEPDGTTTKVNEPGPLLSADDVARLCKAVEITAASADWVVGCGSLPPGAPTNLFADLVARARARGVKVAIDSSGAPMAAAMSARPDLVKPNHEELEEVVGRALPTLGDVVDAARELVTAGTGTVVVSLGGDGAVLVTADRVAHAVATVTDPQSTVGAGDCLLAGLLHALSRGDDPADALATGVAWGAAAVGLPGSRVPSPADVARIRVSLDHHPDLTRLIA